MLAPNHPPTWHQTEKIKLESEMILLMAEIMHQLRLVVYPIIYRVLYITGGAGFLPSTVYSILYTDF